ncbi:MAG TPA: type II secretion system protein [Patescibacteria group bacterium]
MLKRIKRVGLGQKQTYKLSGQTHHGKQGFTLIELLVVTSLTVMIMLVVTSMFMTFLITSQKTSIEQKVKGEGENALSNIEFILRNSRRLVPGLDGATTCTNDANNPMTNLAVEGFDGFITTLQAYPDTNPKIASYSSAINDYYYLTSDETTLSNLQFICLAGEESSHYIGVSFQLQIGAGLTADRETAIETFQSGVTLRNN